MVPAWARQHVAAKSGTVAVDDRAGSAQFTHTQSMRLCKRGEVLAKDGLQRLAHTRDSKS
jgi:hypothetical protein